MTGGDPRAVSTTTDPVFDHAHTHTVSGTSDAEIGHCREALGLAGVLLAATDHRAPTPAQVSARSVHTAGVR